VFWLDDEEKIKHFFNRVKTDGAIRQYEFTIERKDDGDDWWEV